MIFNSIKVRPDSRKTLNKSNSTRSNEGTHGSEFDTLRFIQRIPWKRNAGVLSVRQVSFVSPCGFAAGEIPVAPTGKAGHQ